MSADESALPRILPERREAIERYTLRERLNHWLAGLTYIYLMLTGLALFTPHLYWMAAVLGSGPTVRYWHPWIGLIFFAAMLWMHRMWRRDMRTTDADRAWSREIKKYIENRDDELPPVGRFNAGQKQFYWVMFFSTIVLLLSGIVMWIPEYLPRSLNGLRSISIVIHEVAALITIGAFLIHVYMGIFVVPGGFRAIVHGYVSKQWAKRHHRLWYERLVAKPPAAK